MSKKSWDFANTGGEASQSSRYRPEPDNELNEQNPYAAPRPIPEPKEQYVRPLLIVPNHYLGRDYRHVEEIIVDGEGIWPNILFCLISLGIGGLICGFWNVFRLKQWHAMANKHPQLIHVQCDRDSDCIEERFQRARSRLIWGIVISTSIFMVALEFFVRAILF